MRADSAKRIRVRVNPDAPGREEERVRFAFLVDIADELHRDRNTIKKFCQRMNIQTAWVVKPPTNKPAEAVSVADAKRIADVVLAGRAHETVTKDELAAILGGRA